ncbi:MAG: hypothetical protein IKQ09_11200 [Bacteroidales bacterium]|nr:hypothetical protein [Bacteroidales bacterium]
MKKVFFSLMLAAALALGFTSCDKKTAESETHSQTFSLGGTSYPVDNVITIENIQYNGSDVYNAIVLYTGKLIGNTGGECKGVTIIFKGDITAGTYNLSGNDNYFPKYVFADVSINDIINFDILELADDDAYIATSGSFTLENTGDGYTVTTSSVEVENTWDPSIVETSSVDYEGASATYRLATVQEGTLNDGESDANIVTAGTTKYTLMIVETNVACFITDSGDMIGFTSAQQSFADGVPVGQYTNSNYPIIQVNITDIEHPKFATSGSISVAKDGDVYTIDITDAAINGKTYNMHYVGTLPFFNLPI